MAFITSPMLLDSTGQDIVSKLTDIKTAIENSGGGGGGGTSVDFDDVGTASSTTTRYQQLTIGNNHYKIRGTEYMEQNVVLSASNPTTVTFTNESITTSSVIDVYTDNGVNYETMSIEAGVCNVTFGRQPSASSPIVRIYIK